MYNFIIIIIKNRRIKITIHSNIDLYSDTIDTIGENGAFINAYLECLDNCDTLNNFYAKFAISVHNYNNYEKAEIKGLFKIKLIHYYYYYYLLVFTYFFY